MTSGTNTRNEPPGPARQWLWIGLITAACLAFSRGLGCAMPFAALAALAALNLRAREAAALVLIVWTLNQAVGFLVLHYPHTAATYAWALAIGVAAFLALGAAMATVHRLRATGAWVRGPAAFCVAFAVCQVALYANTLRVHEGAAAFAPAVLGKVLAVNVAAFAGLLGLNALAVRVRLIPQPVRTAAA